MEDNIQKAILASIRDEEGKILNIIDISQFLEASPSIDVYLSFILKTIIDDFGDLLVKGSNGEINKEQFEAQLIENLSNMLSTKTRENK